MTKIDRMKKQGNTGVQYMAKVNIMDTAKEMEQKAKSLFDRVKGHQSGVGEKLQSVHVREKELLAKEEAARKAREERERQERLLEMLSSDQQLAVHIGGEDEIEHAVQEAPKTAVEKTDETPAPQNVQKQAAPVVEKPQPQQQTAQKPEPEQRPEAAKPSVEETPAPVAHQDVPQAPAAKAEKEEEKPLAQQKQQEPAQTKPKAAPTAQPVQPAAEQQPEQKQETPGKTAQPQGQGGYQQRTQGQSGGYQQRPQGQGGFQQRRPASAPIAPAVGKEKVSNYDPNKSNYSRNYDGDKKARNKKALQKEAAPQARGWDEDAPMGGRKKPRKQVQQARPEPVKIEKAVITTETITVKDLSEKIGKPAAEIIKKLFMLGTIATINQDLDFDTCELIASDYGIELEQQIAKTAEDVLQDSSEEADAPETLVERPPVVTIMGHVDHGKTSLLDAIRDSSVTEGEAGGITQHIGAYTVQCNGRTITFIDTPGHEAFTSMRARGAQVTDIVILVVAADDGIMPQTVEAINHAKAAEVPIIVAINKMDRPEANPDRVMQQLTEYSLVPEEWGGETICVPVSAKARTNLDTLLEMVLLQADVLELKANPNRLAKGTIVEAQLDKGRGPIATVLVQNGTLHVGDTIVAGTAYGRVRAMMDDKGRRVTAAGPSQPVEVLGFSEVPAAGDILNVAEIDKLSRQVAEERRDKQKAEQLKNLSKVSLDDLFSQIAEGEIKDLNIIVKADVQGSVEAVKQALEKLSNDEVRVRCIHGGVGAITGTDIMFASASNAIVIGFNVRPDAAARTQAEREKVDIRLYRVIYSAIEDVQNAMKGMFKPVFREVEMGRILVRETFKVSGVGTIAGAYVQEGKVARNAQVRVVRDGIVVHEGKISSLKRFKDDAKEVAHGFECGIGIENFNDLMADDVIEAFTMEEVKR